MINITIENMTDFPIGTEVISNYGAYYAPVSGRVVKHEVVPAGKYFPASGRLVIEQENGDTTTVIRLYENGIDKGIGTYLVKLAEKLTSPKKKSPWSVE
jgi:hypothetical protein